MCAGNRSLFSSKGLQSAKLTSEASSRTLTRSDIASAINKRVPNVSRREAARILDCALQEIINALSQGEKCVKLHEFGTFFVRERAPRRGRNPLTGEIAAIHERKTLNFRPSTSLREKVEKNAGKGCALRL
jgi:integration host factor subunit alpha